MGIVDRTAGGFPVYSSTYPSHRPRLRVAKCPVCSKVLKSAEGVLMHIEHVHPQLSTDEDIK